MTRQRLLQDYIYEVQALGLLKRRGATLLNRATFDFDNDEDNESDTIHIDEVIAQVNGRIKILSNPDCSQEEIDKLNY